MDEVINHALPVELTHLPSHVTDGLYITLRGWAALLAAHHLHTAVDNAHPYKRDDSLKGKLRQRGLYVVLQKRLVNA